MDFVQISLVDGTRRVVPPPPAASMEELLTCANRLNKDCYIYSVVYVVEAALPHEGQGHGQFHRTWELIRLVCV